MRHQSTLIITPSNLSLTAFLKRPPNESLLALYSTVCTHEAFPTVMSLPGSGRTSFMLAPRIVSNAGAWFRKTKYILISGSRFWPLGSDTDTVLQPVGSNIELTRPPDAQGSV